MAKFIYKMQSVLNVKEKMEEQAKMEFAFAMAKLDEEQERLLQLQEKRKYYEEEGARLRMAVLDTLKMKENEAAIEYVKEEIVRQKRAVKKAEEELEKAREKLQEYMMERKTHEILKENAFEVFKQEINREESKEVDELTSYVYGKRIIDGEGT